MLKLEVPRLCRHTCKSLPKLEESEFQAGSLDSKGFEYGDSLRLSLTSSASLVAQKTFFKKPDDVLAGRCLMAAWLIGS